MVVLRHYVILLLFLLSCASKPVEHTEQDTTKTPPPQVPGTPGGW